MCVIVNTYDLTSFTSKYLITRQLKPISLRTLLRRKSGYDIVNGVNGTHQLAQYSKWQALIYESAWDFDHKE